MANDTPKTGHGYIAVLTKDPSLTADYNHSYNNLKDINTSPLLWPWEFSPQRSEREREGVAESTYRHT